ncbi:hypothetical protein [Citrobacter portucalensis]|uniref:hypothetical protein n=1 Tax=Citrobacter portucalensis TaxID=1639133 RepID=UPI00174AD91F|nr:hypothetical protein [Citrobacter portucalensis]
MFQFFFNHALVPGCQRFITILPLCFFHRFAQFRIQTLNFMGESLLTMAGEGQEHFAYESICQLGHSLVNISQLIPALV